MAPQSVPISFAIGSRRVLSVPRRLATLAFSLEDILSGTLPFLPAPQGGPDGIRILSAPSAQVDALAARFPGHVLGGRQDYHRHFIAMTGSYEEYLARFSGKTRATLRRKQRKLADRAGRGFKVTAHRTPAEVEAFLQKALPLSARTYQARLLDAGLPTHESDRRAMLEAAEADRMRCFLLHAEGEAIAYLSLPVEGATLVYAHLGYDPDWARLSPGTVLQMEALEQLYAEGRFRYFDFTEGDGAHKALFGTDSVECASFLLLRGDVGNRLLLGSLAAFDGGVAAAKAIAAKTGALAHARKLLRA